MRGQRAAARMSRRLTAEDQRRRDTQRDEGAGELRGGEEQQLAGRGDGDDAGDRPGDPGHGVEQQEPVGTALADEVPVRRGARDRHRGAGDERDELLVRARSRTSRRPGSRAAGRAARPARRASPGRSPGGRAGSAIAIVTGPVRPQPKMTSTPNDAPIDCPVAIEAHGSAPATATITGIEMRLIDAVEQHRQAEEADPARALASRVAGSWRPRRPSCLERAGEHLPGELSTSRSMAARTCAPNSEWSPNG